MAGMTMQAPSAVHILGKAGAATTGCIDSPCIGRPGLWTSAARKLYWSTNGFMAVSPFNIYHQRINISSSHQYIIKLHHDGFFYA
jgi:hypothetical protein